MSRNKNNQTHKKSANKKGTAQNPTHNKIAAKKAAVIGNRKRGNLHLLAILICAALLAVGAFYYFFNTGKESSAVMSQISQDFQVNQITYPVSLFEDGKARHYEYKKEGVTIKYFILKSSDGIIRAAFDACDVCWPAGKGYYQSGDVMVCRNCGRKFPSVRVNEVKGGCNPAPLNRNIENNKVVIKTNDILDGKQYFDFSGKV
jgi:uncharacterized membrane protein